MDDGSGLLYMRARYYDPAIGRFINKDPIGLLGGLNLYAYVGNNPVKFVDPLGLFCWSIITRGVGRGIFSAGHWALTGGIVGGFVGSALGTLTCMPGMTLVGGVVGGYVGGKIGGYFDPEYAGQLNCGEDEMLEEWRRKHNGGGNK